MISNATKAIMLLCEHFFGEEVVKRALELEVDIDTEIASGEEELRKLTEDEILFLRIARNSPVEYAREIRNFNEFVKKYQFLSSTAKLLNELFWSLIDRNEGFPSYSMGIRRGYVLVKMET
jgi:hypothetical protein